MSLYNMVHGVQPTAKVVLHLLDLDFRAIPRLRDAFIVERDSQLLLAVRTRTGGANRPAHIEQAKMLADHPCYVSDEDDAFDNTFALYLFKPPQDDLADELREAMALQHPLVANLQAFTEAGVQEMTRKMEAGQPSAADPIVQQLKAAMRRAGVPGDTQ